VRGPRVNTFTSQGPSFFGALDHTFIAHSLHNIGDALPVAKSLCDRLCSNVTVTILANAYQVAP